MFCYTCCSYYSHIYCNTREWNNLDSTASDSVCRLYQNEHLTNPTTLPLHSYWLFIMISGEGLEGFHPYVEKNNNKIIIMYI